MNKAKAIMIVIGVAVLVLAIALIGWGGADTPIQGKVISIDKTWNGGDLQHFENITIVIQNHTIHRVVSCDYFHVGDTITWDMWTRSNFFGSQSGFFPDSPYLPVGCLPK